MDVRVREPHWVRYFNVGRIGGRGFEKLQKTPFEQRYIQDMKNSWNKKRGVRKPKIFAPTIILSGITHRGSAWIIKLRMKSEELRMKK